MELGGDPGPHQCPGDVCGGQKAPAPGLPASRRHRSSSRGPCIPGPGQRCSSQVSHGSRVANGITECLVPVGLDLASQVR